MNEIMQRFEQLLWSEDVPVTDSAEELYQSLEPAADGEQWYWKDINYDDQQRSFWAAVNHYMRIRHILNRFGKPRLLEDTTYASKMIGALKFWLANDFTNPNWWHNQIGMPQGIGNITIMMSPLLDQDTLAHAASFVARGSMATIAHLATRWTGANLIWCALNTIRHALLTCDEPLMQLAVNRVSKEITIGMPEGIQEDYSFFQHGARLYSGGYGRSFIYNVSKILFLLGGTRFQLSDEKTELIISFVLDGLRHMTQKDTFDWACVGREITRVDAVHVGHIKDALETLILTPNLPRMQELKAFRDSMQGAAQPDCTKFFDKALMLCHHFNGIYVGTKFMNNRLLGAEICNGEGNLCYNMSYGTHTCIMRNGSEYFNINPVWDYSRIPGTTSRPETDEQLLFHTDWAGCTLSNEHSGGTQVGRRAVIYELAEHADIKMLVADFAFEDGFVCLGTELDAHSFDSRNVVTTIDQCLIQGPVEHKNNAVIHNAIRYTALSDTHIELSVEAKSGSWKRNNIGLSDEPVRADVLTLTIRYPAECKYAYMISAADAPTPSVEVLQNDAAVQAIRLPDGQVMAVFHQPAVLSVDGCEIVGNAGTIIC